MKLFSPKEVSGAKKQQTDNEIARGLKIEKLVSDEQRNLKTLQEQRELQTRQINQEFTDLFDRLNAKRTALEKEIGGLEARKAEALKPIDDLKKALEARKAEFDSLQTTFDFQEQTLLDKETRLGKELDQLGNLRVQMAEERERFDLKLFGLKAQENAVNEGFQTLKSQWNDFTSYANASAQLISDWQRELGQREQAFNILQSEIQNQKKDIELNRTRLIDLQGTIQSAFAEAREKNLL
jgi:chromosome segregation ATPase